MYKATLRFLIPHSSNSMLSHDKLLKLVVSLMLTTKFKLRMTKFVKLFLKYINVAIFQGMMSRVTSEIRILAMHFTRYI
jgi:hypothetical protein